MYLYICICISIYIYIHTYIYTYIKVYAGGSLVAEGTGIAGVVGCNANNSNYQRPPEYGRSCDYSEQVAIIAYYSLH